MASNNVADLIRDVVIPLLDEHETQIEELQEAVGLKPHRQ
jgi:hypothetical protein